MAWPMISVRINAGGWSEVGTYVRNDPGLNINRGATNNGGPYFHAQAGVCTFTLSNRDGRFDPFNLSGAYTSGGVSYLRPGLPVSVRATHNSVTYDLFTGVVSSWLVDYPEQARDSVAVVTVQDAISGLSRTTQPPLFEAVGDEENAGTRIGRILDNAGWTGGRDIDTTTNDNFMFTFHERSAWDELQGVADDVNGYLWVSPAGAVTFVSKSGFPRSADFTIGTGASTIKTATIQVSTDTDQLFNSLKLTREGGIEQAMVDETSATTYGGYYSHQRSGSQLSTDSLVTDSLVFMLSQYRLLRLRVEAFEVPLTTSSTNTQWATMLGLDLVQRPSASFQTTDGRTVTRDGLVRGINLRVRVNDWRWKVSTTQMPERLGTFVLGTAGGHGILGTDTLQAF